MSSSSSSSTYVATRSVFRFVQQRFLASNVDMNIHSQSGSVLSTATKTPQLNPKTSEKHASVLSFFKSLGLSAAHISKLAAKRPRTLRADVEKTLKPKINCFVDYGISGPILHDLIAANPHILAKGLNSHLLPTLRLLQTYLGSNEKIAAAVDNEKIAAAGNNMEPNLNFLVSEGVPLESINKLISSSPRTITSNVDRMARALKSAQQFGFCPVDSMLVYAIITLLNMSESTLSKKTEFVKNLLGLSKEEVKSVFKRHPQAFTKSEEKMKLVANFFVSTVRVESSFVPSIPIYFSYSVDKRLVPRYNVYKTLESKKLLKKGVTFTATLKKGEKWFESNYVLKYLDQVPNLMELYRGVSESSNTQSPISKSNLHYYFMKVKIQVDTCIRLLSSKGVITHHLASGSSLHRSAPRIFSQKLFKKSNQLQCLKAINASGDH